MKVAPEPGPRVELDPAAVRLGDRLDDREAEPGAVRGPVARRRARSARRSARGPAASIPGPRRGPRGAPASPISELPIEIALALAGVADGVLGQVHDRLGEALRVGDEDPDAGAVEAPVAIAEAARLREQVVGEAGRGRAARGAGSRAAAPWRAAAGRRRSGSSGRARPGSRRSPPRARSGESPSVSRWPRITVIGVRSSWLTSARKSFWSANAVSRRSSMPLKVRPSSAISSLPRTGMRPERSVSVIVRAVRDERLERRDRAPGGEPDEQRGEQQDDDRDADRDPHRALDLIALVGGQRGGDERRRCGLPIGPDGDVARLAERRCRASPLVGALAGRRASRTSAAELRWLGSATSAR